MRYAVIPARGGSKRIPRKNVKDFLGKPMIAYAIDAVTRSGLFDHVVVSTDDSEIAEVAQRYGAEVPFTRPPELSDDHASTDAILVHAVGEIHRRHGLGDEACCVYPTSPLLTVDMLARGLDLLVEHNAPSAFPVVRYDFPVEQALLLEGGLHPKFRWPELVDARSQDLAVHYHDAGMFYWFVPDRFLQGGRLYTDETVVFEVPAERCQDINTPDDWAIAELKYQRLHPVAR